MSERDEQQRPGGRARFAVKTVGGTATLERHRPGLWSFRYPYAERELFTQGQVEALAALLREAVPSAAPPASPGAPVPATGE